MQMLVCHVSPNSLPSLAATRTRALFYPSLPLSVLLNFPPTDVSLTRVGCREALWVSGALQATCSVSVVLPLSPLPGYKFPLRKHSEYAGFPGIVVGWADKMNKTLEALG